MHKLSDNRASRLSTFLEFGLVHRDWGTSRVKYHGKIVANRVEFLRVFVGPVPYMNFFFRVYGRVTHQWKGTTLKKHVMVYLLYIWLYQDFKGQNKLFTGNCS